MPRFEQRCTACEWTAEIWAQPFENPPCPSCNGVTERLWTASAAVVGDELPGGQWIENLGPQPIRFDSKKDIVRYAKAHGMEPFVRHTPIPGTDKSPYTTSWAVTSPYQLEAAAALVARMGTVKSPPTETPTDGPYATPEDVKTVWQTLERP